MTDNQIMLNLQNLEKWQVLSDLLFLLNRSSEAGICRFSEDRYTGISSNALVKFAYLGIGWEPKESEYPKDKSDLRACELAFNQLPKHRRTKEVQNILNKYWSKVNRKQPCKQKIKQP